MEELALVLDTIVSVFTLFAPLLTALHLFEICFGSLAIFLGIKLILPILGNSIKGDK